MPLPLAHGHPTLILRRAAFEQAGLGRAYFDARLGLTDEEFRVEGGLVCIGPVHEEDNLQAVIAELEDLGLGYFDDFFETSGNWPDWLALYAMETRTSE
jgi:hypothetical protein